MGASEGDAQVGRGEEALARLLEEDVAALGPGELRRLLGEPLLTEEMIRRLLARQDLLEFQGVRRALVVHRNTPTAEAMRLVPTMFWSDLVAVGRDARARPTIRRAAHQALLERYEGLAVGERMAIARQAGPELLNRVRHDPEPRVVRAMLDNPRLTESLLVPLLASDRTPPTVLSIVCGSEKWISRYQVRKMVCRNRKSPSSLVLGLLPRLKKVDLAAIAADPGVPQAVRKRARLLLGRD